MDNIAVLSRSQDWGDSAAAGRSKIAVMPEPERTSAQIIVEEIRRQVDLQVTASNGLDTKAMAIFAGVAAVAAFIAPRVVVETPRQTLDALATFGILLAALACLLLAVRPRVGAFSNGPNVDQLAERADDQASNLERDLVPSFVKVRDRNEEYLKQKSSWILRALVCLFAAVVGMAFMVGVGAIK